MNVAVPESDDMDTIREKCSDILFNLHRLKINIDCLFLYNCQQHNDSTIHTACEHAVIVMISPNYSIISYGNLCFFYLRIFDLYPVFQEHS